MDTGPVEPIVRRKRYSRRRRDRAIKSHADAMDLSNYEPVPPCRKDTRQAPNLFFQGYWYIFCLKTVFPPPKKKNKKKNIFALPQHYAPFWYLCFCIIFHLPLSSPFHFKHFVSLSAILSFFFQVCCPDHCRQEAQETRTGDDLVHKMSGDQEAGP